MASSPRASRAPKNYDPRFGARKAGAKKKARPFREAPGSDRQAREDRPPRDRQDRQAREDRPPRSRPDRPPRDRQERPDRERPSRRPRDGSDRERSRPERSQRDRSDREWSPGERRDSGDRRGTDKPRRKSFGPTPKERPGTGPRGRDGGSRTGADRSGGDRRGARSDTRRHGGGREQGYQPPEDVVLDRLSANLDVPEDIHELSFADLGLGQNICRQLAELGAEHPFPIQAATIPVILSGRDVVARGRTGSGKTIAFGAPLVERLLIQNTGKGRRHGRSARALVLAPTRELAMQIDRTMQPIARSVGLFTVTVVGGVPQGRQTLGLRKGVDIIIATPGRLEDLANQGHINLSQITTTVLDEADHMCELGFLEPVQRILRQTSPEGQHLLFSATLDAGVSEIVDEFLSNAAVYEVPGESQETSTIDHRVFVVDHRNKLDIVAELASNSDRTLVFTRTRAFADTVADGLEERGVGAVSLHGDMSQGQRTRALDKFTKGRVEVLVATDVAARGIHVDDIDLVIQADPPDEYKAYMHRAGRTGRAGRAGVVVTLIPKTRQKKMADLLDRAGIRAEQVPVTPGDPALHNLLG